MKWLGVYMSYELKCLSCGCRSENMLEFRCPNCGGITTVRIHLNFKKGEVNKKRFDVWRYAKLFPYVKKDNIITLGEGWTPLVKFSENLYFKLENLNPTGSFKDRGSTVLISALHEQVKKVGGYLSEDSSGNAGASIAAYAARAGVKAKIYVPENVSGPKLNQIMFYGADVVKVSGSRAHVADEAQKADKGKFYVGHIFHPIFRDGIRSLAYEVAEQFVWHVPERVYLPVSAGTLLLGVIEGFKHLLKSAVADFMPKIVACQTSQVSPLHHRFKNLSYTPPEKISSLADALVSTNPPLLETMTKSLRAANGDTVMVEEEEIFQAFKELANQGFFVEPSSAVAYAAYKKQLKVGEAASGEKTLIVLTGNGLKSALKPT